MKKPRKMIQVLICDGVFEIRRQSTVGKDLQNRWVLSML